MGVIADLEDDEYWPEFGSVVIRDAWPDDPDSVGEPMFPLLSEDVELLFGTVGRAGEGWLQLASGERCQRVRLEAHSGIPPQESGDWLDVVETPYRSVSGRVGLTSTTGGPAMFGMVIGEPGFYRVRVCRRPAPDDGDVWVVRFWPSDPVEPPRWLVRDPGRSLDGLADDIYAVVSWASGGRLVTRLGELADRLLAGPAMVEAALAELRNLTVRTRFRKMTLTAVLDEDNEDEDNEDEERDVPAVTAPRPGFVNGYGAIMVKRGGRLKNLTQSPVGTPSAVVEYAGGLVLIGAGATALTWDGTMTYLGRDLRPEVQLSRDGTIMAAQEWRPGPEPWKSLHLIDLADGTRHTMPWPSGQVLDVLVTGVERHTVWLHDNTTGQDLQWTAGDAQAVPATVPPPVSGWEGPDAPGHRHYPSLRPGRTVSVDLVRGVTVEDSAGRRTFPLPEGVRALGPARAVWEDPDHLLVPIDHERDRDARLLRLTVTTGDWGTADAGNRIFALAWPWPRYDPAADPPEPPFRPQDVAMKPVDGTTRPEILAVLAAMARKNGLDWTPPEPVERVLPPAGPPPRIGWLIGKEVTVIRDGRPVVLGTGPLDFHDHAVEVDGGVLIEGRMLTTSGSTRDRTVLLRGDGTVLDLGDGLRYMTISRDGTTAAAHEIGYGRQGFVGLHLIDLSDGSRRTLPMPDSGPDLRITGVSSHAVWFHWRTDLCWTAGDTAPRPTRDPPPAAGWTGPGAPWHRYYRTPGADKRVSSVGRPARLSIGGRKYDLPEHIDFVDLTGWEDAEHLLVKVSGFDFPSCLLRLDITSGMVEIAATDHPAGLFIWPRPDPDLSEN
ncbi:hypothetical protein [Actinoplanes sp. HUAS TT8]|uniref:hypothetical protein n=1 Tax=Actinoplanes sp. HUAS TT8 TaxID=3447453 RepID=UPI003F52070C